MLSFEIICTSTRHARYDFEEFSYFFLRKTKLVYWCSTSFVWLYIWYINSEQVVATDFRESSCNFSLFCLSIHSYPVFPYVCKPDLKQLFRTHLRVDRYYLSRISTSMLLTLTQSWLSYCKKNWDEKKTYGNFEEWTIFVAVF